MQSILVMKINNAATDIFTQDRSQICFGGIFKQICHLKNNFVFLVIERVGL